MNCGVDMDDDVPDNPRYQSSGAHTMPAYNNGGYEAAGMPQYQNTDLKMPTTATTPTYNNEAYQAIGVEKSPTAMPSELLQLFCVQITLLEQLF